MAWIDIEPGRATPIWKQIEDQVRLRLHSGHLHAGSPVPSVRELARQLTVNPATVSKAYRRLVDLGFLEVRRGEGTFVSSSPPSSPSVGRQKELAAAASSYAATSRALGATLEDATQVLHDSWRTNGSTTSADSSVVKKGGARGPTHSRERRPS